MQLVKNPSYRHSKEIRDEFAKNSAYIFYKDHSTYSESDIKSLFFLLNTAKPLGMKKEEIKWLSKVIKEDRPSIKAIKEDYIPAVIRFYAKEFQRGFSSVRELDSLSQLNDVLNESQEVEPTGYEDLNIIHEFNDWFIAMPLTKAASCMLGKDTDWCTARDYDNLFFDYCADVENDRILFYLINTKGNVKKNPNDKISISVRNNEVDLNEYEEKGETVNAKQKPITYEDLEKIFGTERADEIIKIIRNKAKDYRFIHPLKDECTGFLGELEDVYKIRDKYYAEDEQRKVEKALAQLNTGMTNEVFQYFLSEGFDEELAKNEFLSKRQQKYLQIDEEEDE